MIYNNFEVRGFCVSLRPGHDLYIVQTLMLGEANNVRHEEHSNNLCTIIVLFKL